ncbi:hypothetical protein D0T85_20915 [Bacteroides sp. 519]|nr:hypothetical protein [Bacteroides sp. 519]
MWSSKYALAIRSRPAMYLGYLNQSGLEHCFADILFSLKPIEKKAYLLFALNRNTLHLKVKGIIPDAYTYCFKHSEEEFWKHDQAKHGLAFFVLACTSESCRITIKNKKEIFEVESNRRGFNYRSESWQGHPDKEVNTLEIAFIPDKNIFKELNLRFDYFLNFFKEQSYLLPYLTIEAVNTLTSERTYFSNQHGMSDYVDALFHRFHLQPEVRLDKKIQLSAYNLDLVIAYLPSYYNWHQIETWAGGTPLFGGSLENGILKGISSVFKNKSISANPLERLVVCAHLRGDTLTFAGSIKEQLDMPALEKELKKVVAQEIQEVIN